MKIRLKSLKIVNQAAIREATVFMLQYRLNKWWVPRQMQACMWELGARVTEAEVADLMEDIFQSSQDNPLAVYDKRLTPIPRYRCKAIFTPKT